MKYSKNVCRNKHILIMHVKQYINNYLTKWIHMHAIKFNNFIHLYMFLKQSRFLQILPHDIAIKHIYDFSHFLSNSSYDVSFLNLESQWWNRQKIFTYAWKVWYKNDCNEINLTPWNVDGTKTSISILCRILWLFSSTVSLFEICHWVEFSRT